MIGVMQLRKSHFTDTVAITGVDFKMFPRSAGHYFIPSLKKSISKVTNVFI